MSVDRTEGRRTNHRAFRPTLDGGLESRFLLSNLPGIVFLNHPQPGVAYVHKQPPLRSGTHAEPFPIATFPRGPRDKVEVAHGGQSVIVATPDGSHFQISLTQFVPTPPSSTTGVAVAVAQPPIQGQVPGAGVVQPIGTVRAYSMPPSAPGQPPRVGLILDGTTTQSELDISSVPFPQRKGYAHSFAYGATRQSHLLNIGQIIVNSGVISAINGYHTADLSGPLTIAPPPLPTEPGSTPQAQTQTVDRISFDALLPGASINIGGDLNTLDVLNGVNAGQRAQHRHRPRPEPDQRRPEPGSQRRRFAHRRPLPGHDTSAPQGDGHRVELPRPQSGAGRDRHEHDRPLPIGIHPGQHESRDGWHVHGGRRDCKAVRSPVPRRQHPPSCWSTAA